MDTSNPALTYTTGQVAQILNVSRVSVYRLIQRGVLHPLPFSRHKLIPCGQIHKLVGSISASYRSGSSAPFAPTSFSASVGGGAKRSDLTLLRRLHEVITEFGCSKLILGGLADFTEYEMELLGAARIDHTGCSDFLRTAKSVLGVRTFDMLLAEAKGQVIEFSEFIVHNPTGLLIARLFEAVETQLGRQKGTASRNVGSDIRKDGARR